MKKKGFTLVELLAVIAILAILVIIALPNIMDLFNDAKKNSFENEVKEIYKTAQSQFITDSINGNSEKIYSRGANGSAISSCGSGTLSLSGRTDIQYGIQFDNSGNVVYYLATDGTYSFTYSDGSLGVEEIGKNPYQISDTLPGDFIYCSEGDGVDWGIN